MSNLVTRVRKYLSLIFIWRNIPSIIMYLFSDKAIIIDDLKREMQYIPFKGIGVCALNYALLYIKPFRSIFRFRTVQRKPWLIVFSWLMPRPLDVIEIDGSIDGGLLLYHKTGCVVSPHCAGKDLTVSQGVTIGKGRANANGISAPIIGNNVRFCTNSIAFGGITIGDNCVIGAGTVLNKSVPDNCTVVGNPPKIVKRNGKKCSELL